MATTHQELLTVLLAAKGHDLDQIVEDRRKLNIAWEEIADHIESLAEHPVSRQSLRNWYPHLIGRTQPVEV